MTDTPTTRALKAMWHRGRKEFTWWTGDEIDARAHISSRNRKSLVERGLLRTELARGVGTKDVLTYQITDLGRKFLEASCGGDMEISHRVLTGNPAQK